MGLDMYMYRVNKTNHSTKELIEIDNKVIGGDNDAGIDFAPLRKVEYLNDRHSIFSEVAYWRKFNALHNWFVTHVQLGIDNCSMYEVPKDILNELLEVLKEVRDTENPTKFEPTTGFFFGSTLVDEYYWERVEMAIGTISNIIDTTDWDKQRILYMSSW